MPPPPLNFSLSGNFLLGGKILPKIPNLGLKTLILKKFRRKMKFRAPIISSVGNLQLSVGNFRRLCMLLAKCVSLTSKCTKMRFSA